MIEIVLSACGMGELATEADFDAWASYVAAHIEERTALDVAVDQHAFSGPRAWSEDTIRGADADQREAIVGAIQSLWENFCADESAWPIAA